MGILRNRVMTVGLDMDDGVFSITDSSRSGGPSGKGQRRNLTMSMRTVLPQELLARGWLWHFILSNDLLALTRTMIPYYKSAREDEHTALASKCLSVMQILTKQYYPKNRLYASTN